MILLHHLSVLLLKRGFQSEDSSMVAKPTSLAWSMADPTGTLRGQFNPSMRLPHRSGILKRIENAEAQTGLCSKDLFTATADLQGRELAGCFLGLFNANLNHKCAFILIELLFCEYISACRRPLQFTPRAKAPAQLVSRPQWSKAVVESSTLRCVTLAFSHDYFRGQCRLSNDWARLH